MKRLFKSVVATTATAAMVASMGASAFANAEMANMEFVGFDLFNANDDERPVFHRIYNEVIDGKFTNKQLFEPMKVEDIEWKFAGYEAAYPHAGYDVLYLREPDSVGGEWKIQNVYRYNNLFPQWDVRRSDYEWEVVRPHTVWERRQTKLDNTTWTWDFGMNMPGGNNKFQVPDSALKTETSRVAVNVDYAYNNYGFGIYANDGLPLDEHEVAMYNAFTRNVSKESDAVKEVGKKVISELAINEWNELLPGQTGGEIAWEALTTYKEFKKYENEKSERAIAAEKAWINADKTGLLSWDALSTRNTADGKYTVTDKMIQALVPVVKSEFITAQLNATMPAETKDVAALYHASLIDGNNWEWDYEDSFKVAYDAEIDWTAPIYQKAEPYKHYQFLIVNGVVCDGAFVEIPVEGGEDWETVTVQKPYIGRYTDGNAVPNVEWKFYMYERTTTPGVFQVVEQKFMDGEEVIINDEPVVRRPNGRFGTIYIVKDGGRTEYRVCEGEKGRNEVILHNDDQVYDYAGNLGGFVDNFGAGPADVRLPIDADEHPQTIIDELRAAANVAEGEAVATEIVADVVELESVVSREIADEMILESAKAAAKVEAYKVYVQAGMTSDFETFKEEYFAANLDKFVAAFEAAHADAYKAYLELDPAERADYETFKDAWVEANRDAYIAAYVFVTAE